MRIVRDIASSLGMPTLFAAVSTVGDRALSWVVGVLTIIVLLTQLEKWVSGKLNNRRSVKQDGDE